MYIRASVDKCRKEKSYVWHIHNPVTYSVVKCTLHIEIAETGFGQIHMTDRTHDILIYFIRCIVHQYAVGGLARDIVCIMDKHNKVISCIVVSFNNLIIEFVYEVIVFEFAFP